MDDLAKGTLLIEGVLDALVDSYEDPWTINNLETCALPNRRAVVEAFGHLQHLFFLGYFSTRRLSRQTLRLALAEHMMPAQELLSEQIRRAVNWQDRSLPVEERRPKGWCGRVVMQLLQSLPRLRATLNDDVQAAYDNDPAAMGIEEVVFSYPGMIAITAHRVAHELHCLGVPMVPRILSEYAHAQTGIDIHPGATIGRRFFIDHGTGVVLGATCHIGDDVKIYQGVTLGALSVRVDPHRHPRKTPAKRHPTLEDRVTVYAGATILGGNTVVGADSVIGGNVWLVKSVPPGSKIYHRPDTLSPKGSTSA